MKKNKILEYHVIASAIYVVSFLTIPAQGDNLILVQAAIFAVASNLPVFFVASKRIKAKMGLIDDDRWYFPHSLYLILPIVRLIMVGLIFWWVGSPQWVANVGIYYMIEVVLAISFYGACRRSSEKLSNTMLKIETYRRIKA